MKHILYGQANKAEIAILIKETSLHKNKIQDSYIAPASQLTIEQFIAFSLAYQSGNKCTAAHAKDYLSVLLPVIDNMGIKTLLVTDAIYFKYLTKNTKADPFYGYVCPCKFESFEHMNIILAPNFQAILYNPSLQQKLDRAIDTLMDHIAGTYQDPGTDIIHFADYPETPDAISNWLNQLKKYPKLTCDIEARSLKFYAAGISTISFAWNKHEGIAFAVDRGPDVNGKATRRPEEEVKEIKQLLKQFFLDYQGVIVYHNASYDMKVIVYELWMKEG